MADPTALYALVVDDNAIILMDACVILEGAGFHLYKAPPGDEAKELLEQFAEIVTLLFSDVEMPSAMNGFALARYVAEHWPWIEIVITSGQATPKAGEMPDNATFVPKPFSQQIVHDHLRARLPDKKKPERLHLGIWATTFYGRGEDTRSDWMGRSLRAR